MTDLENIEKGIHFNRNYSKTGFTKKNQFPNQQYLYSLLSLCGRNCDRNFIL